MYLKEADSGQCPSPSLPEPRRGQNSSEGLNHVMGLTLEEEGMPPPPCSSTSFCFLVCKEMLIFKSVLTAAWFTEGATPHICLLAQENVEMFSVDASFLFEMLLCIYSFLNP